MDWPLIIKGIAAFSFVIALMLLLSWFLKKIGLSGPVNVSKGPKRLSVVDHTPLDHRRRLVLIRRDDREHLIILGPNGETLVEKDIQVEIKP